MKTHTICHKVRHPVPLSFSLICSLMLLLLISPFLSFFLFLTQPLSRSLALINSRGLPSDAFQAPSSYHRPGLGRRPEGYWLNGLKLGEKRELSSLKIKTLPPPSVVDRECRKNALSCWSSEKQKLFYLLDRDTAAFTKHSTAECCGAVYCFRINNTGQWLKPHSMTWVWSYRSHPFQTWDYKISVNSKCCLKTFTL